MTTDLNSQNKLPETIVKRNGSEDRFDRSKISNAIYNALRATGEYKDVDINEFTGKLLKSVLRELRTRKEDNKLHVEDVQDIIENKLMDKGLHETARYFIKYRFLHKINREKIDGTTLVDCNQTIDEYVGFTDWRIKANSNTTYSNAGMVNNTAGKVIANYWLDKVYSPEEGAAHRNGDYHIHDLDSLSGYCAGWNLRALLNEGFNGVRSRVNSRPPKHFREALGQMANFLGILQSEWAGAQAFSSFDTFLAPYVFRDQLPYEEVKKAIRGFVYNLNVPSRWGQCVPTSYKCLRGDGKWVTYDELNLADEIYVIDPATGKLKKDVITRINSFTAPNIMHEYKNAHGFNFQVTPNHRVIYKTGSNSYKIKESSELINYDVVDIPISQWGKQDPVSFMGSEYDIQDELLELITYIITDGTLTKQEGKSVRVSWFKSPNRFGIERFEELCAMLDITYSRRKDESTKFENSFVYEYRLNKGETVDKIVALLDGDKHSVPSFVQYLSPRQCYIMLDAWVLMDGHFDGSHWKMQADNKDIQEMLAYLTIKSGKGVSLVERKIGNNKNATRYTNIHKRQCRSCTVSVVESSCDTVWCPTTNTGTFVCMTDEGYVFITGNSPFTNVTIDWTVPQDLKEQFPTRSDDHIFADIADNEELMAIAKERGVESLEDMCYKHFQPEMDIIQKAYYEVMTEGDSTGQPFTFPIPTVNITEDFDWEGKNVPILFENAAKIGSSYFQNFVGSQYKIDENGNRVEDEEAYKPSAVRSMCPLTLDTEVLTDKGNVSMKDLDPAIHKIYSVGGVVRWNSFTKSPVYTDSTVYKITFENGVEVEMSSEHLQPILDESGERNVVARDLQPGMRGLFISNPDTEKMLGGESQITSVEKVGVKATQCIQVDSDKEEDSIFVLSNGLVTHNCRLQLDLNELRKRGNGLFGSAESTGSTGVVTINLARLGYLYKGDKEGLYSRLNQLMDMAKSTLEKKRAIITDLFERGLYPYTKRYLPGGFNNHFSTIGVNGGNEMIRNFTNDEHDITTEWGQNFAEELLNHIRARLKKYQNETGNLYNLEASPSEGTTYRFAREDLKRYPDIIQAGCKEKGQMYYTNSTQLPSWYTHDLFKALKMQDKLQTRYTGGTVFHMYMNEAVSSSEACRDIVRKVLTNFKMPYITVTPLFSVCDKHGYLKGQHDYCPICDEEIIERETHCCTH